MKLYNTLTRSLQEFQPLKPPAVTMYVCGPTVYDVPHIGHARSAYIFDVLRRYLEFRDYRVTFVRNVTDVDDKIINRAREESRTEDVKVKCAEIAEKYLKSYHDALDRLGITRPTQEPRATTNVVPEMTDFISKLLIQGAAYEAKGDVYFAVRKFEKYGMLSNRTLDELHAGARVEPGEHKQDPLDFALWKAAKPGEPSWPSPWGPGRPGWHIECSAMSTKYLGDQFDIHGGGVDLVFPHHENEIAQAVAAGKPFARFWVHNGLLTVNGEKMSKSLGNYITVDQVFETYPQPSYLKLFFLKTHYRSPIDYSSVKMDEAKKNWQEFYRFFQHFDQRFGSAPPLGKSSAENKEKISLKKNAFVEAMDDDLNTPKALAVLFDLVNFGHQALESTSAADLSVAFSVHNTLIAYGETLGLFAMGLPSLELSQHLRALLDEREAARKAKNFKRADEIRKKIEEEGYLLTDTPSGPLYRQRT